MKKKWQFICSLGQLIIGTLAIVAFVILAINGEVMTKWMITFLLAIAFVVLGIIGIVAYKSNR